MYTERIQSYLRLQKMSWAKIPIPRATLDHCKRRDIYTTEQLEIIAQTLGIKPYQLLYADNDLLLDEISSNMREIQKYLAEISKHIENLK